jgi:hypothetical protein
LREKEEKLIALKREEWRKEAQKRVYKYCRKQGSVARLKEGGLTGQTDRWSRGKGERLGMLYSLFTKNGIVSKDLCQTGGV